MQLRYTLTMITKFIGLKQFRQNLADCTKQVQSKKVRYIVLKKNAPMFEVKAVDEKKIFRDKFVADLKVAEDDIKAGRVYTQEQIMKEFGLR